MRAEAFPSDILHITKPSRSTVQIVTIHALTFATLLAWSWRKWPDPLVDFGRELYLPWQITEGRVLYRDLESLFGPLSPYINAVWFRLFGTSLLTLALCNAAIFAATVAGIHHLVRISADRVTATAASLSTVVLFGFSQYDFIGNYNFITPYSHEATHGFALSVAALLCLYYGLTRPSQRLCAAAGFCFGLTLLTKPEIAIATAVGLLAGWLWACLVGNRERSALRSSAAVFVAAAVAPALLFLLYFATHMDPETALRGTAGAWVPLFGTGIAANQYYRQSMGLDSPLRHVGTMVLTFAGYLAFVVAAIAVAVNGASRTASNRAFRAALLIGVFVALRRGMFPQALPLIALALLVAMMVLLMRRRAHDGEASRELPLIMWSAFALSLLGKMGVNPRYGHYGFYLALPATVAAIALTIWFVPQMLAVWKSDAAARSFRQLALFALTGVIAPYLGFSHGWYREKTLSIGSGADRFYASAASPAGPLIADALAALEHTAGRGTTVAVLPEGVMLNYLLRVDSPLRVVTLMPPELMAFGEDSALRSLVLSPPDLVVLLDRGVTEYGYPAFGSDPRYGLRIMNWIDEHYEVDRAWAGGRILRRRVG